MSRPFLLAVLLFLLTGVGFGGWTVNLVAGQAAGAFARGLAGSYTYKAGLQSEIYICRPAGSAGAKSPRLLVGTLRQ